MEQSEEARALTFRHWHQEMINVLIEAGFQGHTQKALLRHFKKEPKDEVLGFLEMLVKENKAQKFKHGTDIIWRATDQILV